MRVRACRGSTAAVVGKRGLDPGGRRRARCRVPRRLPVPRGWEPPGRLWGVRARAPGAPCENFPTFRSLVLSFLTGSA